MNYEIRLTPEYIKKSEAFIKVHKDLSERYIKTMRILADNPRHPSLRLHKLHGKLDEYYSISLSMQYRIIIDFIIVENVIIPLDIGSHNEVY